MCLCPLERPLWIKSIRLLISFMQIIVSNKNTNSNLSYNIVCNDPNVELWMLSMLMKEKTNIKWENWQKEQAYNALTMKMPYRLNNALKKSIENQFFNLHNSLMLQN